MTSTAQALDQGIGAFNRWRRDAMEHIETAIGHSPDNALAHVVKGLVLTTGRNVSLAGAIDDCLANARKSTVGAPLEASYIRTLEASARGDVGGAVTELELVINKDPANLFAHRLAQQELFWVGEVAWMRDIVKRARPHWDKEHPDYGPLLSVAAFSHEEAGEHAVAEQLGREAVDINSDDCWGAHAVAHVLEMQNRSREGEQWLRGLCANWDDANQIAHHLWWHLCLFLLEHEQHDEILSLLYEKVRNVDDPLVQAVPDAYIDIQNVASILLRLELRGLDVREHWESIADVSEGRIANHPSPFTSAHAAMVLAAAGRAEKAQELVESLSDAAGVPGLGPRIAVAALPAAQATLAHRRKDYAAVIDILMPARRDLKAMGGSHAQRDIFLQMLAHACGQCGKQDHLRLILEDLVAAGFTDPHLRSGYRDLIH